MRVVVIRDGAESPGAAGIEPILDALTGAGVIVTESTAADSPRVIETTLAEEPLRTAVLAVGPAARDAVDAAAEHGAVAALVGWFPEITSEQVELVREWPELPVLSVATSSDRASLRGAVDLHLASEHDRSDLLIGPDADVVTSWILDRLRGVVDVDEVTCESSDGWEIHGTRRIPASPDPVPGVVLLHTGRSDRVVYTRLERLLAEAGLGVLNIDWRGRGRSINQGTYFELDDETKFAAWRDAAAAFEALAADPRIDSERMGAVGCVHGAEYAVRAAVRDRRVRAIVVLTGYRPADPEEAELLTSGEIDVMYVTGTGQTITGAAMRDLWSRTPPGRAQFVEYPGSALGYQLFELDHALEPRVASWLAGVLA